MSKKVLSLVLALVMVLGTFGTAFAAATTPTGNEKVDKLIELGLVQGDANGYRLADNITRAEVATMVVRALDLEAVAKASAAFPSQFVDMNSANVLWARGHVNVAAGQGIINGYPEDGTFKPANNVTYAEAAAMLVRVNGGLTAAEQAVAVWPTTYLAKAAQLGIFANVDGIVDYNAPANRENLFEMVFNTLMTGTDLLIANTIEGIVVENYRTETLAKNEVVVHVMKDQDAKNDKYDVEKGEEFKVVITPELAEKGVDVETLLGKVVKVAYDKNDKVVGIEQLAGYNYVSGIVDEITSKTIKVAGKTYTVEKTESRAAADERLYQVYENNDDIAYDVLDAEYANITVKNGKVLFIDAYEFDDIAPVAKDIDSKNKVAYYDDSKDGDISTITVDEDSFVINFVDGVMQLGNYEDISANDVIHFFGDTVIVRPSEDNMIEGKYEEANAAKARDAADIKLVVDKAEYPADIKTENRNPVYSLYSSELEFLTLTEDYDFELEDFEGEEVVLLLDMFGKVQLIGSETVDAGFYAIITNQYNYDFELYKADKTKSWYDSNRSTTFDGNVEGATNERKLNSFVKHDLVKATASDDVLTKLTRLTEAAYDVYNMNKNVIAFSATEFDYIAKDAIVFVVTGTTPKAMDVATFLKNYDVDEPMKGYVGDYDRTGTVAKVIVITAAEGSVEETTLVAKVTRVAFTGGNYWLTLETSNGETSRHKVTGTDAKELVAAAVYVKKDAILEFTLTKDDNKDILDINYELGLGDAVEVVNYGEVSRTERFVVLDAATEADPDATITIWLSRDADVFGTYRVGSFVKFTTLDAYNVTDLLVVTSAPTSGGGSVAADGTLEAIYTRTNTLVIEGTLYEYAGNVSDLSRLVGKEITFDSDTIGGTLYAFNIKAF